MNIKNKITILIITLLLIVVIGGLYIFSFNSKKSVWSQSISQSVKDICKEKDKIEYFGNCFDGFSEHCYFDSIKYKKNELISGFSFPKETKQACLGIHSASICGKYQNKFELKKDGEFKEVSCEEFLQTIEDKNKSCGGCIDEILAGCC
ncbi:MAG: hypothetical protein QXX68_01870 [Candidatus Pacearchaeota archaeon]